MFELKHFNKKTMINDIVKIMSIMIACHICTRLRKGDALFDEETIYSLLFTSIGFMFYHIVVTNFIKPM